MEKLINKLIVYHQIHKMRRSGWKVSRIADFLVINRRTVSKYLSMTEQEYFAYQESIRARKRELDPYEGFVKIKLELFPQTSAAQMHDWLKEHYDDFPVVSPKTVFNFVMKVRQEHNIPKTGQQRDYSIVEELPFGVKDTVNCTTFDTQKCTTLRSKMMLNLFRNQKPDHNVQSGYVLYSKNLTQEGL